MPRILKMDFQDSLDLLVKKHHRLAPLVTELRGHRYLEPEFFKLFFRCRAPGHVKGCLLNLAIFGKTFLTPGPQPPLSTPELCAISLYLQLHPKRLLSPNTRGNREDIPHSFSTRLGLERASLNEFVRAFGLLRYAENGQLKCLEPIWQSRLLDINTFRRWMRSTTSKSEYEHYFNTGVDALNFRNCLFFSLELLDGNRRGGKVQDKIPKALSDFLRVPRISLPSLLFACDVYGLWKSGVVDTGRASGKNLRMPDRAWLTGVTRKLIPDLGELLNQCFSRSLLLPHQATRHYLTNPVRSGIFETTLLFNMHRLLRQAPRRDIASKLRRLLQWYRSTEDAVLRRRVLDHYRTVDPAFRKALVRSMSQSIQEYRGIEIRDIANTLYLLWVGVDNGDPYLPSAAAFTLGHPEPAIAKSVTIRAPATRVRNSKGNARNKRNYSLRRLPRLKVTWISSATS